VGWTETQILSLHGDIFSRVPGPTTIRSFQAATRWLSSPFSCRSAASRGPRCRSTRNSAECAGLLGPECRMRHAARKIAAKSVFPSPTVEFAVLHLPTDATHSAISRQHRILPASDPASIGSCQHRILDVWLLLLPAVLRTIHPALIAPRPSTTRAARDLLGVMRSEMLKIEDALKRLSRSNEYVRVLA
jgi:hypothetical protein